MSKVTIPIAEVEIGGSLQTWHYDNAIIRTDVTKTIDNGNSIVEGNLDLSISDIGNILAVAGEVEEHLMSIYAPIALLDSDVPDPLPNNKTLDGTAATVLKDFKDWFVPGAEAWKKDTDDFIIFYSNPFAGNEDKYLTGSELSVINGISGSVDVHTVEWAQNEVLTGWTKIEL